MIRGALLDIDGTLLDSNDAHAAAYAEAFMEAKIDVPFERLRPLIGMGSEKLLPAVGVDPESQAGRDILKRKKEIFAAKYLPGLRPFAGVRDLLEHMKSRGLARVVATSAGGDELAALLRATKIEDLVDAETTSSDAGASKPDPDIVEAAIARSRLPRRELVLIGDTPYDVEAAARAGVRVIALRCGGWSDRDLKNAQAIYDDPAALLAEFARSPLASG